MRKRDRKSTRLNSSHLVNPYAVFCFKEPRPPQYLPPSPPPLSPNWKNRPAGRLGVSATPTPPPQKKPERESFFFYGGERRGGGAPPSPYRLPRGGGGFFPRRYEEA